MVFVPIILTLAKRFLSNVYKTKKCLLGSYRLIWGFLNTLKHGSEHKICPELCRMLTKTSYQNIDAIESIRPKNNADATTVEMTFHLSKEWCVLGVSMAWMSFLHESSMV